MDEIFNNVEAALAANPPSLDTPIFEPHEDDEASCTTDDEAMILYSDYMGLTAVEQLQYARQFFPSICPHALVLPEHLVRIDQRCVGSHWTMDWYLEREVTEWVKAPGSLREPHKFSVMVFMIPISDTFVLPELYIASLGGDADAVQFKLRWC